MDWSRNEQLEDTIIDGMTNDMYDGDRHQPSVTGMIYCLTKTFYENEMVLPDSDGRRIPPRSKSTQLLFTTGLALEKVLLGDRQVSEGGEYDGIQWHVDHFNTNDFIEIKTTRARTNKDPNKPYTSDGWIKQILSYCKVKGITEGDLVILHLLGGGGSPMPDLLAWHFTATQQEIDDNWAWIQRRAIVYYKALLDNEPPKPFQFNMDWECRDCNWLHLCNARKTVGDRSI